MQGCSLSRTCTSLGKERRIVWSRRRRVASTHSKEQVGDDVMEILAYVEVGDVNAL
jgi:hypothetical protein